MRFRQPRPVRQWAAYSLAHRPTLSAKLKLWVLWVRALLVAPAHMRWLVGLSSLGCARYSSIEVYLYEYHSPKYLA